MYRHLLVPIDDSDLSIEVIGNAVGLARALGARITFFHADTEAADTWRGEAEVLRLAAPALHAQAIVGKPRELLAKAEAAARACGVPCEGLHRPGDPPSAAIVALAHERGCDLIFMASHGHRHALGMALASETLQVLMQAGLPVLVAATGEPRPPARAIATLRDEHRSIAAVLHAWQHTLAAAQAGHAAADTALMGAMLHYLRDFPAAQHHPKEERLLFSRLRERTALFDAELDELQRQHQRDGQLLAALAKSLHDYGAARGPAQPQALVELDAQYQRYAAFVWDHLGREEGVILPAAQRHLNEADWAEIDAAFGAPSDPLQGASDERQLRQLFSRIVNLAPQPAPGG